MTDDHNEDNHYFKYIKDCSLSIIRSIDLGQITLIKVAVLPGRNGTHSCYVFKNSEIYHHINKTRNCVANVNSSYIKVADRNYLILNLSKPYYENPRVSGFLAPSYKGAYGCGPALHYEFLEGQENITLTKIQEGNTNYHPVSIGSHPTGTNSDEELPLVVFKIYESTEPFTEIEALLTSRFMHRHNWEIGIDNANYPIGSGFSIHENGTKIWPTT